MSPTGLWDEALDTVAQELIRVRDTYGPASILYFSVGGDLAHIHTPRPIDRLFSMAGGFTRGWGSRSFGAGLYACEASYGTWHTGNDRDDLLNSRLIILWGWDPASTICGTNTTWYLAQARETGCRIIAVDPRYTDTAATLADEWIPIQPGTDAAALIAMAYVIIRDNLQDQGFLDTYTIGFDHFKNYVMGVEDDQPKTPAWAEAITKVPAGAIERLGREYATTKPAALMAGFGAGRTAYGEQYHRAAIALAAMTGNVGIHGGSSGGRAWESIIGGFPYKIRSGASLSPEDAANPVDEAGSPGPPGAPSIYRASRVHYMDVPDFILKGKAGGFPADCRMLYIVNSNYLNQHPNVNKIVKALKAVGFLAIQEQFMTPTAKFADILLPTTTFLERNDINNGVGIPFYGYVNKVIEPIGECKSHLEIAALLAPRLGITNFGSAVDTDWLERAAKGSEIPDYEKFKRDAIYKFPLREPYVRFKEQIEDPQSNPFPTPSGKIEIYCKRWADLNDPQVPPIPKYIEPWESPNDPLAQKYPLQLITTHFKRRALGQFDNLPELKLLQRQAVMMNPLDAEARGISDGDTVRVFNDRGETLIPAWVTERIMPGVVDVPHGAWYDPDERGVDRGGCANVLTLDRYTPAGAMTANTGLVQVERARERAG